MVAQNTESESRIFKQPSVKTQSPQVLGVRNALIGGLRLQFPTLDIPYEASYCPSRKRASPAGLVIGGGARARSAVYALSLLGLRPIFLLNRDDEEIERLMGFFPNLKKKKGLIYLKNTTDVVRHLAKPVSPVVLMVVGAIRAWDSFTHKKIIFFYLFYSKYRPSSISRTRHDGRTYAIYHSFGCFENSLQTTMSTRATTSSFATFVPRNDSAYIPEPN